MTVELPPDTGNTPQLEISLANQTDPDAIVKLAELLGGTQALQHDDAQLATANVYDGHVALVLDDDLPADFGSTLDFLTHAHDLFEVPAINLADAHDDAAPT